MNEAPPAAQSRRSTSHWPVPVMVHASLADFLLCSPTGESIHTIGGHQFPLDVYVKAVHGRPLLVCFHGAAPEGRAFTLPIFSGLDFAAKLGCSLVACSDASLHLSPELRIGWHQGTSQMALEDLLHLAIRRIADVLSPSMLLFTGGSAGGFAAISMARHFPGSVAVVSNPQLVLRNYNAELVGTYLRLAFGLQGRTAAFRCAEPKRGFDLVHDGAFGGLSRVLYLQNASDQHHVNNHLMPLLLSLNARALPLAAEHDEFVVPWMRLFVSSWATGHVPPPRTFLLEVLQAVLEAPPSRALHTPPSLQRLLVKHLPCASPSEG